MVERETLANGLIVLLDERPTAESVALHLMARAGSRDDGPTLGITTLTSRLMFQGTHRRPSETALLREAALVGGTLARGTGGESSEFVSQMPAREAGTGFDLLADLVVDPLMDEGALGRQQQIALQELSRRRSDPGAVMADLYLRTMYAGHPLGIFGLGTPESVASLTVEDLQASRRRQWGAQNLVLAIAGKLSASEALDLAGAAFGALPPGERLERPPVAPPAPRFGTVTEAAGQQQALFRLGFVAPDARHEDRHAMRVLNALTSGASGRLFEELRNVRGLAYSASSGYDALSDAGSWYATAGVDPQNLEPALEVVRAEVQRLREAPPPAAEVELRIGQFAGQQILAAESNAARAARLAAQEVLGIESREELVEGVRRVTPVAIWDAARTYLDPQRAVLAIVRPAQA
jgi:predicted Zn-dependent peptidase